MKIKQGYTLSQFVDYIEELHPIGERETGEDFQWAVWHYNKFLKQPLNKEMFINEIGKPDVIDFKKPNGCGDLDTYYYYLNQWKEAEKKVIFKGWSCPMNNNVIERESFRKYENIAFYKSQASYDVDDNGTQSRFRINTIADLFESTKGQLETQNINI